MLAIDRGIKISNKPTGENMDALQSLAQIAAVVGHADYKPNVVAKAMTSLGVSKDTELILQKINECHATWVLELKTKVDNNLTPLIDAVVSLKLPAYPDADGDSDNAFIDSGRDLMQRASAAVSKLKAFMTAVQVCFSMASIDTNLSKANAVLSDGQTFILTFTLVTVLMSPTWRRFVHRVFVLFLVSFIAINQIILIPILGII